MTPGLGVWRCNACGHAVFPERIFCPSCHAADWSKATAHTAVIEEVSMIHHMIGQENWQKRRIASVLTDAGCRITAGLLDDVGIGEEAELCEQDGAPFVRAKGG